MDAHVTGETVVTAYSMLRWIVLVPLVGAIVNLTLGRKIEQAAGRVAVAALGTAAAMASFAISVLAFLELRGLGEGSGVLVDRVAPWLHVGSLDVDIAFQFDPLTAVMCLVVTGVGSLIHVYSYGYMDEDPANWRFFGELNLFLFAMLTLVTGDNLLLMFVGWEGVGLCSWALIGFWHREFANTTAANKAFLVNRIGDFSFLLGMFLLFWTLEAAGAGTLVFRELPGAAHHLEGQTIAGLGVVTVVTLLLFGGATGKSAQIPLFVWLPDAMAGPTPVSALIHAATMVTAGIYMIARLGFLFTMAPITQEVVAVVGAATALLGASIAVAQWDIKKVLAYSTVSQLGYMTMAMGVGAYGAGVFHLLTHAFFKACLFLGAGSVIHAVHHEQDMRRMGGLRSRMPITFWTFVISALAIAGIPLLSGFFSKDEILWQVYQHNPMLWAVAFGSAGLTAFYMFRLVFLTFFGEPSPEGHAAEAHESHLTMTVPLMLLAAGAVTAGALGVPASLGGSNILEHWLAPVLGGGHGAAEQHASVALEYGLMAASVGAAAAGIAIAWMMYVSRDLKAELFSAFAGGLPHRLALDKFYIDEIYEATFVRGTLGVSRALAWFDAHVVDAAVNLVATVTRLTSSVNGALDNRVVDGLVNATADVIHALGGSLRRLQTGSVNGYLYALVVGATAVLLVRAW